MQIPYSVHSPYGELTTQALRSLRIAILSDRHRIWRANVMQHHVLHADLLASVGLTASETRERQHIELLARRLYILAWVIEGVAVALGLGMALSLNLPGQSTIADLLLGGGGFVMVACAELSKIPLATFFVESTSRRAKAATLVFLLLMSFITFETIFMSLERGFDARLQAVRTYQEQLNHLQAEHAKITKAIENPGEDLLSTRAALEKQLAEIDRVLKSELGTIADERQSLHKQHQSNVPKEIEAQLDAIEAGRKQLSEARDRKVAEADDRARKSREFWLRERNIALKAGDLVREQEATKRLNSVGSGVERKRIEAEYSNKVGELEVERKRLVDQRAELVRSNEAAIKPRLDELSQAEKRLHSAYGGKRDEIRKRLDAVHTSESELLGGIEALKTRRDNLVTQTKTKESEYRRTAAESQLHRIATPFARLWTGVHYEPHTIPETYVRTISVIWFGSMAILGAIGGAVVAMVSQLLRRRANRIGIPEGARAQTPDVIAKRKFWTSLRRMLVSGKFSRTKTKTVEVVKVERETKLVAVPVPVNKPFEEIRQEYDRLRPTLSPSDKSSKI